MRRSTFNYPQDYYIWNDENIKARACATARNVHSTFTPCRIGIMQTGYLINAGKSARYESSCSLNTNAFRLTKKDVTRPRQRVSFDEQVQFQISQVLTSLSSYFSHFRWNLTLSFRCFSILMQLRLRSLSVFNKISHYRRYRDTLRSITRYKINVTINSTVFRL